MSYYPTPIEIVYVERFVTIHQLHTAERPECRNTSCICHQAEREREREGDTGKMARIEREERAPWRWG